MHVAAGLYRAYVRILRAVAEGVLRLVPSPRGNDGLTANERRLYALKYAVTAGTLPTPSPERVEHLHRLADKAPARTWRRSVTASKTAC